MPKSILILLTIAFLYAGPGNAQSEELRPVVSVTKSTCFTNSQELERLYWDSQTAESIIILSHVASTEKKRFGVRRLHNASTFLRMDRDKSNIRSKIPVIAAEGSKVVGTGYVDFFVNGRLQLRIFLRKNSDLVVSPCVAEPEDKPCSGINERLFYPCKAKR